jgi:hypothetical protein
MNANELALAYEKQLELRFQPRCKEHFILPDPLTLHGYEKCEMKLQGASFAIPMIDSQVCSDLLELVNSHNNWVGQLCKWRAWIQVMAEYESERQWDLRIEFVDPIARSCMFEPSAMRDRLLRALVFVLHHKILTCRAGYADVLLGDKQSLKKGELKVIYLSRNEMMKQSFQLSEGNAVAFEVLKLLDALDSDAYREATQDYRNACSHSIAPHFEQGVVQYVSRYVYPGPRVSYGFGERAALSHTVAFHDNRKQLLVLKNALVKFELLLSEIFAEVTAASLIKRATCVE